MSDTKAECEITRILPNGEKEVQRSCFTMDDAVKAGLAGRDVWKKYPRRMLKHRCLSYGLKDVFPDLLAGLYDPEEMESVQSEKTAPTTERNVTPVEEPKKVIEEPKAEVVEGELIDDRQQLKTIIEKYEAEMNVQNQNGNPYELACSALAENDPEQISKMLVRCKKYLSFKGIQVA